MLQPNDEQILQKKGISLQQIEEQLRYFVTGFPYLQIRNSASIGNGIIRVNETETQSYLTEWDKYLTSDAVVLKFVPASGAASRMFKDLFGFLEGESELPVTAFEKKFFDEIQKFAFYDDLNAVCATNSGKTIPELISTHQYKEIVANLLLEKGLNYGALPKGLLKFHS